MFSFAGVIAQPVLIDVAVGISLRVSPDILLHIACLTAKGEGCCRRTAGFEIVTKIRVSSFGLAGGLGRGFAGARGRLLSGSEILGPLTASAQERGRSSWLFNLLWSVSLLQRELGEELLGESEVRAWMTRCCSSAAILIFEGWCSPLRVGLPLLQRP